MNKETGLRGYQQALSIGVYSRKEPAQRWGVFNSGSPPGGWGVPLKPYVYKSFFDDFYVNKELLRE